jgi:hypothetical protein
LRYPKLIPRHTHVSSKHLRNHGED